MFHEDREIVTELKQSNKHFEHIFNKHNELHDAIEAQQDHKSDVELEVMKKQKLKYKDELYTMIVEYKKSQQ
jgi:uncharacterized protein YdcH (DUF465 family)